MRGRFVTVVSAMALIVGFLMTQQIRTVASLNRTAQAREARMLGNLLAQTDKVNVRIQAHIGTLKARLAALGPGPNPARVAKQLGRVLPAADLTQVDGEGVAVAMHDGPPHVFPGEPAALSLVHDQYVLRAIALISAAGARAISINGQRYTATTSIYCAGPTIRINGVPYASPFVIRAVGPAHAMMHALKSDPDIGGWSQLVSIKFHTVKHLEIPPYTGFIQFSLAKPVKIGG